ncbi:MAG: hypothetical protein JWM57_3666 [Phycisphaerales bacterium]|nr:hypothetical protein [Phycisphaerales bacterium]
MRFVLKLTAFAIAWMVFQTATDLTIILTTYRSDAIGPNYTEHRYVPGVESRMREAGPLTQLVMCNVLGVKLTSPVNYQRSPDTEAPAFETSQPIITALAAMDDGQEIELAERVPAERPRDGQSASTLYPIQPKVLAYHCTCR